MKVLIVGAGIGGLTLAAFLKEKKIDFDIIEKASDWHHFGYSLGIWHNGREILKKLGLEKQFDQEGNAITEYHLANSRGKIMRCYHFDEFNIEYSPVYTNIHRKVLHKMLHEKVGSHKVQMKTHPIAITQNKEAVEVRFNTRKKEDYDLVVGADGINSQVRELVFGKRFKKYINWRSWYFWVPRQNHIPNGAFEIIAPEHYDILFDDVNNQTLVVLSLPLYHTVSDEPMQLLERLKKHYKNNAWKIDQMLDLVKPEDIRPADIAFLDTKEWVKGRVVLLGDAAHAMEPFGGQGASMAMEDAYVLSEELSTNENITEALKNYYRRRIKRVNIARAQTRESWWWARIKSNVVCRVRDWCAVWLPSKHFTKGFKELLENQA